MKIVVLLLGENDEYLWNKQFPSEEEAHKFTESLHDLMIANIQKTLGLKERLKLAPEYFPFAGRVWGVEIIEIEP